MIIKYHPWIPHFGFISVTNAACANTECQCSTHKLQQPKSEREWNNRIGTIDMCVCVSVCASAWKYKNWRKKVEVNWIFFSAALAHIKYMHVLCTCHIIISYYTTQCIIICIIIKIAYTHTHEVHVAQCNNSS